MAGDSGFSGVIEQPDFIFPDQNQFLNFLSEGWIKFLAGKLAQDLLTSSTQASILIEVAGKTYKIETDALSNLTINEHVKKELDQIKYDLTSQKNPTQFIANNQNTDQLNTLSEKIDNIIFSEMNRILKSHGVQKQSDLDSSTKNRYDLLDKLKKDLIQIKADVLKSNDNFINAFSERAKKHILDCLEQKNLDKYTTLEKVLIGLLNILIFPGICKLVATCGQSFFYSMEGRSKEVVRGVVQELTA